MTKEEFSTLCVNTAQEIERLKAAIEKHRDEYNKLCAKYPASDVSADIDARLYAALASKKEEG